jgi:penicillin-binding protein 2
MSLSGESAEKLRAHAVNIEAQELDRRIAAGYPFLVYVDRPLGGVGLSGITALARYGGLAQNLIGYIDADGHGVAGIEAAMDDYLYADGYSYSACFTADAARRALAGYGIAFEGSARPMTQGVTLSLDRQIQQICEEVADERVERGVILVSDLETAQADFRDTSAQGALAEALDALITDALAVLEPLTQDAGQPDLMLAGEMRCAGMKVWFAREQMIARLKGK